MGWGTVPSNWISYLGGAGKHTPPSVEVRALKEGVGWSIITQNANLIECDDIETKIDYFSFGGAEKSKDIRLTFEQTESDATRDDYFDGDQGNVGEGWPILIRIAFDDLEYRTIFVGKILRVETGDDGSVVLVAHNWFSWWLDNNFVDDYYAFTPQLYATQKPHSDASEFKSGASFVYRNTLASELGGDGVTDADGWPATFYIVTERGIPTSWLNTGRITCHDKALVEADDGDRTYYDGWFRALTIHTMPKRMNTKAFDAARKATGVNWMGGVVVPESDSPDGWELRDRTLFSLSPPFCSYNASERPFSLLSGSSMSPGAAVLFGPDPDSNNDGPDSPPFFTWSRRWTKPYDINFHILRKNLGETWDGLTPHRPSPYSGYNDRARFDCWKEVNEPLFGDPRGNEVADPAGNDPDDAVWEDPAGRVCFSPAQDGRAASDDLLHSSRTRIGGALYVVLQILGDYQRPPIPEIDGASEYDLQDAFTSTELEANGYAQTAPTSETLFEDVPADYLETGSRFPLLGKLLYSGGLADDVLKPGAKFRDAIEALATASGVWVFQSPFGQIDLQLARPVDGFYDAANVTVPVFRGSTSGAAPNIGQSSADRNAWGVKWKTHGDKLVASVDMECQRVTKTEGGVTKIESYSATREHGDPAGKDAKHSTKAVLSFGLEVYNLGHRFCSVYGDTLTTGTLSSPLRFISDDRDRAGAGGVFLRMGRPVSMIDAETGRSGIGPISRMVISPVKGEMTLDAVIGDTSLTDYNCFTDSLSVNYGGVELGDTLDKTITIHNGGPDAISGSITLVMGSDEWEIISGGTYTDLATGDDHDIVIRYTPANESVSFTWAHLGGDSDAGTGCLAVGPEQILVQLSGFGFALPRCYGPQELDFKEFYIGKATDKTVTIANYGSGDLTVDVLFPAEDDYAEFRLVSGSTEYGAPSDGDLQVGPIGPGETEDFKIRFRPSSVGKFEARVRLDAGSAGCICGDNLDEITLKGEGIPVPDCFMTSLALDFGNLRAGSSLTRTFTQSNTANDTLTGTIRINQGTANVFAFTPGAEYSFNGAGDDPEVVDNLDGTYTWTMGKGDKDIIWSITAAPAADASPGIRNCIIDMGGSDCKNPWGACVIQAQDGGCTVSDLDVNFDYVQVSGKGTETVRLTNPTDTAIQGQAQARSTHGFFEVDDATPGPGTSTATETAPDSGVWNWEVQPGEYIDFDISFEPTSALTDNGRITWGETSAGTVCYATGLIGAGYVEAWNYPSLIDFGHFPSNTEQRVAVVITNNTLTTGDNLKVEVGGTNGVNEWGVIDPSDGSKIAHGDTPDYYEVAGFFDGPNTHTVVVYWNPDEIEGTWNSAALRVWYGTGGSDYVDISIQGAAFDANGCHIGTSASQSSVYNKIDVGDILVGESSSEQTIRVYNLSERTVGLYPTLNSRDDAWARTSGDALGTNHWVVHNDKLEIGVTLTPVSRGVQLGKMTFGPNCGDSVTLFGRGVTPRDIVDINPSGLLFSVASDATQQLTATIYNTSESMTIECSTTGATIQGPAAGYFSFISGGGTFTIAPGAEHTITIECDPSGATSIGWAFLNLGRSGDDLEGLYLPMSAAVTDALDADKIVIDASAFANTLTPSETDLQAALDALDDHTVGDHSDGDEVLLRDGTVPLTGDLDLDGNDLVDLINIIRNGGNISIDMRHASSARTLQVKNTLTDGEAHLTVQDDVTVGGDLAVTGLTAERVLIVNSSGNLAVATMTDANLEELRDGSETTLHKHKPLIPLRFGQRDNRTSSDFFDTPGLVSGYAEYRSEPMPWAGSIRAISAKIRITAQTTAGDVEVEAFVDGSAPCQLVVAVDGVDYYQGYTKFASGLYTFAAGDEISAYGRLAGGFVGSWDDSLCTIWVELDDV